MKETNSQVRAPHELGVSDEIAISVSKLSKKYQLYDSPTHRLKEALHPFRKKYHHDFMRSLHFLCEKRKNVPKK